MKLTYDGQSDIVGQSPAVSGDGHSITARFDLAGRLNGPWTMVVTNPVGGSRSAPVAFTIQGAGGDLGHAQRANVGSVTLTIAGHSLTTGTTAQLRKTGQTPINGLAVAIAPDGGSLSASFLVEKRVGGAWDVVVTTSNGLDGVLSGGLTIQAPFRLYSVAPSSGPDSGSVTVTLTGAAMDPAMTVTLTRSGQPDIVGQGTGVAPDSMQATTIFDLRGKAHGAYDVTIRNPAGSTSTLTQAFTVLLVPHLPPVAPTWTQRRTGDDHGLGYGLRCRGERQPHARSGQTPIGPTSAPVVSPDGADHDRHPQSPQSPGRSMERAR